MSLRIVALRKESVDRNTLCWSCRLVAGVALRKESVDRNKPPFALADSGYWSLSARRAWIEMPVVLSVSLAVCVALRKESVDRNGIPRMAEGSVLCRSPQGERG